ncbi:AT-rich interactive domain-containing protein 1B [Anopheles bellator]|uniref:AT-rich interactive domain-containing protein 1B n=1 Tax=Anopheles bellator TaxID=139047 RepID=UPI0026496F7F|nr:AT-rich interactive domain-containing protein 1B [Anopheles bellator]
MKDRATMGESTPICRCRVLYLGSAVPRQSKDGLQGIQEPLRSLYPSEGAIGAKGIDSWLSVWSNGILLENVDENRKQVTRFFPIDSLHYCAAVRQVLIPERGNSNPEPKFLPLDSPFARTPRAQHPPIFAAILRRTTGIKVLECHTFICKREAAANALVRCCFHAYADNSYARQLEGSGSGSGSNSVYGTIGGKSNGGPGDGSGGGGGGGGGGWRSRAGSTTTLNSLGVGGGRQPTAINGVGDAYTVKNLYASSADLDVVDDGESSLYNGDENHKVWNGSTDQIDGIGFGNDGHYDIYSGPAGSTGGGGGGGIGGGGSTLGRPARIRQISAPVPVPPPPKEEPKKSKKDKKLAKSLQQQQQQHQQHLYQQHHHQQQQQQQQQQVGGSQSLSGTLIRPRPLHMNPLGRPAGGAAHSPGGNAAAMAAAAAAAHHGMMMYHHHPHHPSYHHPSHHPSHHHPAHGMMVMPPPPPPVPGRQFHTIGHRSVNGSAMAATAALMHHPHPALGMPMPHPAAGMTLPAMMAMAPQYATLQHPRTGSKKKKDGKAGKGALNGGGMMAGSNGSIPIGVPIVPPMFAYAPAPTGPPNGGGSLLDSRPLSLSNRKLAQSAAAGLDDVSGGGGGGGNSGAESPGGTGIYRRKGHLNERAFSYSIRQEHRSRSHGSLASLQFSPPDLKKEREIAQMVAGLELADDATAATTAAAAAAAATTLRRRSEMPAGSSGTFGKPRR